MESLKVPELRISKGIEGEYSRSIRKNMFFYSCTPKGSILIYNYSKQNIRQLPLQEKNKLSSGGLYLSVQENINLCRDIKRNIIPWVYIHQRSTWFGRLESPSFRPDQVAAVWRRLEIPNLRWHTGVCSLWVPLVGTLDLTQNARSNRNQLGGCLTWRVYTRGGTGTSIPKCIFPIGSLNADFAASSFLFLLATASKGMFLDIAGHCWMPHAALKPWNATVWALDWLHAQHAVRRLLPLYPSCPL